MLPAAADDVGRCAELLAGTLLAWLVAWPKVTADAPVQKSIPFKRPFSPSHTLNVQRASLRRHGVIDPRPELFESRWSFGGLVRRYFLLRRCCFITVRAATSLARLP
jgi:hypothetical protein